MAKGKLIQNGVHLKAHEYKIVKLFLEQGEDIELIPPSTIKGVRMPDIVMQGVPWEMKSPEGSGKYTLKNAVQNASHQSQNIIIDLRNSPIKEPVALRKLMHYFNLSRRLKRMIVISKKGEILDYSK